MKKKANKKELQDIVARLIGNVAMLEQRVASYNTLFSMYVKYKDDSDGFQVYLKEELEKKDAEIGQVKDKEVSE
tara:strand:- start:1239 stop:1460 length:222 start_codon:yes stop_codon:yes gene_type:complete